MTAGSVTFLLRSNRARITRASSYQWPLHAIHDELVRRAPLYSCISRSVRSGTLILTVRAAPRHHVQRDSAITSSIPVASGLCRQRCR